jgi:hypothetical protein
MTSPRRRVIRPAIPARTTSATRLPQMRSQLEREQQSLSSWTAKLKRAFHTFEKLSLRIARLQRRIRELEQI